MRKFTHPRPIAMKEIPVSKVIDGKVVERPYEFTFAEFMDLAAQLPAWRQGGSNDEAAARMGALERVMDAVEATEPGGDILLENDDHDALVRSLRESQLSTVIAHPRLAGKAMRFVHSIAAASRVDEKKKEEN